MIYQIRLNFALIVVHKMNQSSGRHERSGNQWEQPGGRATVHLDYTFLILKIRKRILALIYVIFHQYFYQKHQFLCLHIFLGYAMYIPQAATNNSVCFGGMAAILVLIGFSKTGREKQKPAGNLGSCSDWAFFPSDDMDSDYGRFCILC